MLKAKRKVLESLSDEEGLAHTAKEFGEEIMPLIKSWLDAASANPEIKLIRYEDLTGKNQVRVWDNLLQHCDIHLPTETLASVLKTYSFGRLSGGREKGQEVKTEKYRKGVAGDWRNYFTSELAREFVRWNGDVVEKAGYAESGWSAEVR